MQITFSSNRLGRHLEDDRSRTREYGSERARKLRVRLSALVAAECLEELRDTPGRLHQLRANRRGQFAVSLDGSYRLVFIPVIPEEEAHYHTEGPSGNRFEEFAPRLESDSVAPIE